MELFEGNIFERQIDFIFDFIFLDLAEKAGKEYLLNFLIGKTVGQEAKRAFIKLVLAVLSPKAVGMARSVTPIADFFRLAKLKISCRPRTNALVA